MFNRISGPSSIYFSQEKEPKGLAGGRASLRDMKASI